MSDRVRISAVVGFVPEGRVDTVECGAGFGYGLDFLEGKLGMTKLARKGDGQQASDLCVEAVRRLESQGWELDGVELVVVCTQTPDGHGIPHVSAVVHAKLGLVDECACFDISLGCSGYVYGLSVVKAFMEANGLRKGLFFTSDPYSQIIDPEDQATCLLFGDAATVTLLEAGGEGWLLTDVIFGTRGKGGDAIHNREGRLAMDGRAVFNFAMTTVPKQINELLGRRGVSFEDIDKVVLHQGSRYIVEKLRERMKLPEEKVPVHLAGLGNTVSSAIPLTLESVLAKDASLRRIVVSGFGVGLSYASGLLERVR